MSAILCFCTGGVVILTLLDIKSTSEIIMFHTRTGSIVIMFIKPNMGVINAPETARCPSSEKACTNEYSKSDPMADIIEGIPRRFKPKRMGGSSLNAFSPHMKVSPKYKKMAVVGLRHPSSVLSLLGGGSAIVPASFSATNTQSSSIGTSTQKEQS